MSGLAAQEARATQPATTLHLHWRRLVRNVGNVLAGGGYIAYTAHAAFGPIRLVDTRTHRTEVLTPPNCIDPRSTYLSSLANGRLTIYCLPSTEDLSVDVDVFDFSSETWTSYAVDPSLCTGSQPCAISGAGTTWIRFFEELNGGGDSHGTDQGYLQNIATGAVIPDPADTPGQQDNLNTPSGSGDPCGVTSSAYHSVSSPIGIDIGSSETLYYQLGSFVLQQGSTNKLRRCGTGVARRVPDGVFASSKAILYPQGASGGSGEPIMGLMLPTLRPFYIAQPIGQPAVLSNKTLYTITDQGALWAATL